MSVIDHDPVIICPYDENHRIARSRIQRHLVKCAKNFPPNYKKQCPYDATHRVFEHELMDHVQNCPMKYQCPYELSQNNLVSSDISFLEEVEPNNDEVWDEDLSIGSNISNLDNEIDLEPSSMPNRVFKCFKKQLRPPRSYAESRMMETDTELTTDDDAISVKSDQGIGRGRIIPRGHSGHYQRGMSLRGRLGH